MGTQRYGFERRLADTAGTTFDQLVENVTAEADERLRRVIAHM